MKFKINIALLLLYISSFSNFFIETLGLDRNLHSYILLILDLGIAYLGFSTFYKNKFNTLAFVFLILLTFFNFLAHDYLFLSYINGLREIVIVVFLFSFYEALAKTRYKLVFQKKFNSFMSIFIFSQIPITFYQFLLNGAGDEVGGSMGVGFSGVLTLVMIMMVYTRIKNEKEKIGIKAYYNVVFLIPLFLNETKISFILIPLMFLCLSDVRKIGVTLLSVSFGAIMFFALNNLYSDRGNKKENPFMEMFNGDYLENYLLSDAEYGADIPRFTKFIIGTKLLGKSEIDLLLGIETGAFKGGNVLAKSTFSRDYNWLLLGSVPYIFYLMISGGLGLLILIIGFIIKKIWFGQQVNKDKQFMVLIASIFLAVLFYNDAFRNQFFTMNFAYFSLLAKGYFFVPKRKV